MRFPFCCPSVPLKTVGWPHRLGGQYGTGLWVVTFAFCFRLTCYQGSSSLLPRLHAADQPSVEDNSPWNRFLPTSGDDQAGVWPIANVEHPLPVTSDLSNFELNLGATPEVCKESRAYCFSRLTELSSRLIGLKLISSTLPKGQYEIVDRGPLRS